MRYIPYRVVVAFGHMKKSDLAGTVARQRGVATHAVRALCGWAFAELDLEIIEWRTEVGNIASRRVAEKAGFLIEATLRKRQVHRGMRVDVWVGSLLKCE